MKRRRRGGGQQQEDDDNDDDDDDDDDDNNNNNTWRKPSRSRVENQQTQPTYDAESGNRTRATLVGGECSTTAPTLLR